MRGLGVPFGKEMENAIDIRSIADVTHLHVEIDESLQIVHLYRKSGPIRQMIDQGVDFAQIKGIGKNFLHIQRVPKINKYMTIS